MGSNKSLEVVNKCCYLGEISAGGVVEKSIVSTIRSGCKKFRGLLKCFHCAQKGNLSRYVSGVLFAGSETWAVKEAKWTSRLEEMTFGTVEVCDTEG